MTIAQKSQFIQETLNELFPNPPIPLIHKDAYTLLIAVLLSAQCTDHRVNQITPKLWLLADNPELMQYQPVERIQDIIRPCGLSAKKAEAIRQLSKILIDKHAGKVPSNYADLESLPGVGHKTASVVMSQVFNIPSFPVDTHIHRLATRWELTNGKNVVQTEKDLKSIFPEKSWNLLHLQIIYFGRKYCKAKTHNPLDCPICSKIV